MMAFGRTAGPLAINRWQQSAVDSNQRKKTNNLGEKERIDRGEE